MVDGPTDDEAQELIRRHHIVAVLPSPSNNNADLFLELGNGDVLAFWAGSDYGPPYWVWEPEMRLNDGAPGEPRAPST
jgi:hypothetical protein